MVTSRPEIGQVLVLFCCNVGHGYIPASDLSVTCFFAVILDMVTSRPVIGQLFVLFCCNTGHDYIPARDWSGACSVLL